MKVILIKPKTGILKSLILLDIITTIPIAILIYYMTQILWITILIILIALATSSIITIYTHILDKRAKIIDQLKNLIEIRDRSIIFKEPLKFEFGEMKLGEYIVRAGRHSHRRLKLKLNPKTTINYSKINIDELNSNYLLIIDETYTGALIAPYLKPLSHNFNELLIIILNPKPNKINMNPTRLIASSLDEYSEARMEIIDGKISGYISRLKTTKSRSSRLELIAKLTLNNREYEISKTIFSTNKRYEKFNGEIEWLKEPIIILMHRKTTSILYDLTRQLELETPIISGFKNANYKLKLTIDIPFARDIQSESEVKIEIEE